MKQIGWHRLGVLLTLAGLLLSMALPATTVRAEAAETPLAVADDMDICEEGDGSGKVAGRVTRATDGTPVQGARIFMETVYENQYTFSTPTFTDADGYYEFSEVAGGSYVVYADANAVNRVAGDVPALRGQVYDGQATMATFTPVQVVDGATTANINFALAEGGKIVGRITQADDENLRGTITLYHADTQYPAISNYPLSPADHGYYTVTQGLEPGAYKLSFRLWGESEIIYYPNTTIFDEADVFEIVGAETKVANMVIPEPGPAAEVPTGEIRGKVTLPEAGNPKDIVRVKAYHDGSVSERTSITPDANQHAQPQGTVMPSVFEVASTTPDANGLYTLTVPAGNLRVGTEPWYGLEVGGPDPLDYIVTFYNGKKSLDEAETIVVPAHGVVDDINIALTHGSRIRGRVTYVDGSGAVAEAMVAAFTGISANGVSQSAMTTADVSGYYTLPAVAGGVYTVTATVGPFDDCRYPVQIYPTKVEVNGADPVPNINFALAKGAFITGRVTDAESGAGVVVAVRGLLPQEEEITYFNDTVSARTGHFRLGPLTPGEYTLFFVPSESTGLGQAFYDESTHGTEDREGARTFTISGDEIITGINIALLAAPDDPDDPNEPTDPDDPNRAGKLYMPSLAR